MRTFWNLWHTHTHKHDKNKSRWAKGNTIFFVGRMYGIIGKYSLYYSGRQWKIKIVFCFSAVSVTAWEREREKIFHIFGDFFVVLKLILMYWQYWNVYKSMNIVLNIWNFVSFSYFECMCKWGSERGGTAKDQKACKTNGNYWVDGGEIKQSRKMCANKAFRMPIKRRILSIIYIFFFGSWLDVCIVCVCGVYCVVLWYAFAAIPKHIHFVDIPCIHRIFSTRTPASRHLLQQI